MNTNIDTLKDLCFKPKKEVDEYLEKKSDKELLEIFEYIIKNNPFSYESAIEFIVNKLYSSNETFVKLLCSLIEKTAFDLAFGMIISPIKRVASNNPKKTVEIVKKIIDLKIGDGLCSGIIISQLLEDSAINDEIISHLKSNDLFLQKHSLVAIHEFLTTKSDTEHTKFLIENLIRVVENIDQENTDILVQCLIDAFFIDRESILPVLEREIERRGYLAAIIYAKNVLFRRELPISLLKKAVQIIESENSENEIIDIALARIYEEDKDYVINKLRERIRESDKVRIAGDMLIYAIQKDYSAVIQMLEEEIDNRNYKMVYFGEHILKEFFPSKKEWLDWCKKWKDDERKRKIILRSLGEILTDLMNYKPSTIRDEAITLVKEFASKEGIDYEKETKKINLGKDTHEGAEYKESTVKALYVVKNLLHPPARINTEILRENLKNYPYLSKAIGDDWLIKIANSRRPHLLAYIYSEKVDYEKISELSKKIELEKDVNKKLQIAWQYEQLVHTLSAQLYWEQVFKTLDEYGLKIPKLKQKLKNPENAKSVLAEAEVIARLAPHFKVKIEPDIPELRPKRLDAKIEFNGQECLIEIAVVKERIEVEVSCGPTAIPGGKVKNVLLSKFRNQLKEGKVDPKMPVVLVLCLENVLNSYEVENAIYGQLQLRFKMQTDTGQIIEEGTTRAENSFYDIEGTNIVTAIAAYKRNYTKKDPLVGKLYQPPLSVAPKNPLSRIFRVKLRNALFGESECSNWRSLLKIEGIDENMAKKLYDNGIEDLRVLAMVTDEDLKMESFDIQKMKEFQREAIRVINALATNSIKFLKGINQDIYNILLKNNIYLINQIIELTETPEGIDSAAWKKIREDAKRIMENHNL
ncbi:MAG: hypothetical protein H0Z16_03020 [Thermodesulfobacterium sp.]|nr:hypothetical protein [Thermodesulfobacterium sp.]